MTSFGDDGAASLEFHSESALLASLRALLNESKSTVQRCVVPALVVDERHERTLQTLLDDVAAQAAEQYVELLVCACAVVPLPPPQQQQQHPQQQQQQQQQQHPQQQQQQQQHPQSQMPAERACGLLCALFARLVAPAIVVRASAVQLQRASTALFAAADAHLPHAAAVRCLAALRSFWPSAAPALSAAVPLTDRWLASAVRAAESRSHAAVSLCWAALRLSAAASTDAAPLAATLECLATQTALALSAADVRLLRAFLLAAFELFAAPAAPLVVESEPAVARVWIDALERARSTAAHAETAKLVESAYARLLRLLPHRADVLARLARESAALPSVAPPGAVLAQHALLCECLAAPLAGAPDSVALASAALDNVAFAHAAAVRSGVVVHAVPPWRRAAFAVSVWLTTTALHARGAVGADVELLLWQRALAPSRVVAAAGAGAWAFALRNGAPDYRRRQVEALMLLLQRGGCTADADERLAELTTRALPLAAPADGVRLAQCLEQLPRLAHSPLRRALAACSVAHLRPLPADLPPYREPLAPAVVQLLQRCAAAPVTCARQQDTLMQWCVAALADGDGSGHNAGLVLAALAALAELPRGAPLAAPRLEAALRNVLQLERRSGERVDVQLAARRLVGAGNAFVLSAGVFEGAFAALFRSLLTPRHWLVDAHALAAFQRFAKFAADASRCQSLLTSETSAAVLAHLNQKLCEAASDWRRARAARGAAVRGGERGRGRGRRRRGCGGGRARRVGGAAARVGSGGGERARAGRECNVARERESGAARASVSEDAMQVQAGAYEPVCFKSEALQEEAFSVEAFIGDCRRRAPTLEHVLRDVAAYGRSVDANLVELINKDYKDFVALSANLQGLAGVRDELGEPLRALLRDLHAVRAALADALAALDRKLAERRELARKQRTLELLARLHATLARLEALLGVAHATSFGGAVDVSHLALRAASPASAALLERLSADFAQLRFCTAAAAALPLVRLLDHRIAFAERTFAAALAHLFADALAAPLPPALPLILRGFLAVAATADAEAQFCALVVRPWLERTLTRDALDAGGARGSCAGLPALCDAVVAFVERDCRCVLAPNAPPDFDFLTRAVWPEVERVFAQELAAIFRPAIPDQFHRHYTTAMAFVARLERLCADDAHRARLRASPAFAAFERRWNLAIYFQLRFQDLRTEFEEALAASQTAPPDADADAPPLRATTQLTASLQRCWAADVLLRPLVPRFFKLSLQFVARYEHWLRALLGGAGAARAADALLVRAFVDSERLARDLDALFARCVAGAGIGDERVLTAMRDAFRTAVAALGAVPPSIADALVDDVVQRSTAELAAVRAITAAFRMTNRPAPRTAFGSSTSF
jgi:hypothetical protein